MPPQRACRGIPLNGEIFDGLVALYAPTGNLGGYTLKPASRP